jgi:hypothetical protein
VLSERITEPKGLVAEEAMFEAAYLVERRVRPIALCGTAIIRNEIEKMRLVQHLNIVAQGKDVKQFVVDFGDGTAQYGFASAGWVLDLYQRVLFADIPAIQKERIFGLIFGYGIESIARYEDLSNGRLILAPISSESDGAMSK